MFAVYTVISPPPSPHLPMPVDFVIDITILRGKRKAYGYRRAEEPHNPARFSSSLLSCETLAMRADCARFIYVRVTSRVRPARKLRLIGDEARASKLQLKLSVSIRAHGKVRDTGLCEKANYSEVSTNFSGNKNR